MPDEYLGPISAAKLNPIQNQALTVIRDQNQRCYNPSHPNYPQYGALGIRVEYTTRQFIAWYEKEYSKRPHWNKASCGRIDHTKNYSLDNIQLMEQSENSKERIRRCGNPSKRIAVEFKNVLTGEVRQFSSKSEAARHFKLHPSLFYKDPLPDLKCGDWVWIKEIRFLADRGDNDG